jgi:TctA family transporter
MLIAGVLGFYMERFGFPIAPTILGVVLGTMLEQHFFSSLIKADGNFLAFFERPIAGVLGAVCVAVWLWPLGRMVLGRSASPHQAG